MRKGEFGLNSTHCIDKDKACPAFTHLALTSTGWYPAVRAMMCARVVLPRPGGPLISRICNQEFDNSGMAMRMSTTCTISAEGRVYSAFVPFAPVGATDRTLVLTP